jgi:hypothetical protein
MEYNERKGKKINAIAKFLPQQINKMSVTFIEIE